MYTIIFKLDDRARGLMAGIAAGNLLGIVQEGWPRERIAAEFPEGVREIEARSGYPDDDDVAQAIVIAAAAAEGPLDPHDLGRRFGALLGARFGIEAIPRRWRNRVAEIRAGRTPMETYAERLLAARAYGG